MTTVEGFKNSIESEVHAVASFVEPPMRTLCEYSHGRKPLPSMVSDCDEAINRFGGEELMMRGASYEIAKVLLPQAPQNASDEVINNTREFK